jgi:Antitoxin of toxin-antitoxin stability system
MRYPLEGAKMAEIDAVEAESIFDVLLKRVEAGEEFIISRNGVAVAKLVSTQEPIEQEQASAAVEDILKRRALIDAQPLCWDEVKKMPDEGRP